MPAMLQTDGVCGVRHDNPCLDVPRSDGTQLSSDRFDVIHTRKLTSATAGSAPSARPAARPATGSTPSGAGPGDGTAGSDSEGSDTLGKLMDGSDGEAPDGFLSDLISVLALAASAFAASNSAFAAARSSSGVGSGGGFSFFALPAIMLTAQARGRWPSAGCATRSDVAVDQALAGASSAQSASSSRRDSIAGIGGLEIFRS